MSSIFKPAHEVVRPFGKVAADGYQGSGKSLTIAAILVGIYKDFSCVGPMFIMDNERSSKFLVPFFREQGIKDVQVVESDSLAVFRDAVREVEQANGALMVDGLTKIHFRTEADYLKTVNRANKKTIEIQDRPILNSAWRDNFEEPFVKANCHIGFTGRAAIDWGNEIVEDEVTGKEKRTFFAKGVKMAGQKESLYAPDYAIYMERVEKLDPIRGSKEVWREATILKDRSRRLDGETFRWNPADVKADPMVIYRPLAPMFHYLLEIGQPGPANEVAGSAAAVFGEPEGNIAAFVKRREVALEEIEGLLTSAFPGQKAEEKKAKVDALRDVYGTTSWTALKGMKAEDLENGLNLLRAWIAERRPTVAVEAVTA